jgi:hypothetical protein
MNKMRGLREHAAKQKRKLDWNTKNKKQKTKHGTNGSCNEG